MKLAGREKRHKRITRKLKGTAQRPRLVVFRSKKHIYTQLVNDQEHKVITGCSTLSKDFSLPKKEASSKHNKKDVAKELGRLAAARALKLGISKVCFDIAGYKYHGRVKALADGARQGGLKF